MSDELNQVPRRNRIDLNVAAELAIRNAMLEVEKLGGGVTLTNVVFFLEKAKNFVGDYVDENPQEAESEKNNVLTEDQKEVFGLLIDEFESLSFALKIPFAAENHVKKMKEHLPRKIETLKQLYVDITDENPWK